MNDLLPGMPRRRSTSETVVRIRTDYLAMPSLRLTLPQVLRLWGLDETTGTTLLAVLVEAGFLQRTAAGAYMLAADGVTDGTWSAGRDDHRNVAATVSRGEVPCIS